MNPMTGGKIVSKFVTHSMNSNVRQGHFLGKMVRQYNTHSGEIRKLTLEEVYLKGFGASLIIGGFTGGIAACRGQYNHQKTMGKSLRCIRKPSTEKIVWSCIGCGIGGVVLGGVAGGLLYITAPVSIPLFIASQCK